MDEADTGSTANPEQIQEESWKPLTGIDMLFVTCILASSMVLSILICCWESVQYYCEREKHHQITDNRKIIIKVTDMNKC